MAKKIPTWLLGCGIGCGVIILVIAGGATATGIWVKGLLDEFDGAVETREEIEARFGEPGSFVPPPDGSISPTRMEVFLAVRDDMSEVRQAITETFSRFPMTEEEERAFEKEPFFQKMARVLSFSKGVMGLGHHFGSFFHTRNQSMLQNEIGMGEYTYIYVLAYYTWLGHSQDDGPGDDPEGEKGVRGRNFDMKTPKVNRRIHANILNMLENQLDALASTPDDELAHAIEAEIAALEEDVGRLPRQDGLPAPILASLEPYRDRLVTSYSAATNQFDLAMNRRSGPGSFTSE